MICTHLKQLYQLCESNQIRLSSADLVRITCRQCDAVETCPSMLMDEYDARQEFAAEKDTKVDDQNATKPVNIAS